MSRSRPAALPAATLALAVIAASAAAPASAAETKVTLKEQTGVSVTIYNANLAMVRDQRSVTLAKGLNQLAFESVSARIRPETALLSSGQGVMFRLLEQNFDYDLLTPRKLLEKSVGGTVRIVRTNPRPRTRRSSPPRS